MKRHRTVTFSDGTKLREVRTESGTAASAKRHFVRDHLGSVRAVVDDAGTTLETDDYYPLGGPLPTGTATALQPEKYQGKEWNTAAGINVYDFGARLYDPGLGRWISQDPMAEKYYSHSPYLFCAGNPMKFVDPEGFWIQSADGILEAEKGDNAWTLADFLNTSSEIAIMLLAEQGYSIKKNGVLDLKTGDKFIYNTYADIDSGNDALGFVGNVVRSFLSSDFSKSLFDNYWLGLGDRVLSGKEFAGILMYLKETKSYTKQKDVFLLGDTERLYPGSSAIADFYNSPNYARAFGRATIYLNPKGRIIGFYDTYDFNSLAVGKRTLKNEIITRLVNIASPSNSKKYEIRYGYHSK
ncbi:MAG: RHS repeat-associated core domain-containing protein [Bacteroidales bacterium]|nr:RHS repeat-associated core domain-containing protein [Bacteroidales bacterium]